MLTATTAAAGDRPGQVSIHRVRPEGWTGPTCAIIGQGPWLPRAWPQQFTLSPLTKAFRLHLDQLDPVKLWDQLHRLADGHEPVLVNDAMPRLPNLMVRRMTAAWFRRTLGEEVPDLDLLGLGLVTAIGSDPWAA